MSTRCQIIVEGSDVVIYRHSDGYPDGDEGVLKGLIATVGPFVKARGFDECYLPAHIVHDQVAAHVKWANEQAFGKATKYLGYGVEAYNPAVRHPLHGDIDFLYVVKKNGEIEVRSCFVDPDGPCNIDNTRLLKAVTYSQG